MTDPLAGTDRERLVADLLGHMDMVEKAGQLVIADAPDPADREAVDRTVRLLAQGRIGALRAVAGKAEAEEWQRHAIERSRLGIPLLFPMDSGQALPTVLPTALAMAASFDMDAVRAAEAVTAAEAAQLGYNWLPLPDIHTVRAGGMPRAGDSGDAVTLAARLAAARIAGLQERGEQKENPIAATLTIGLAEQPRTEAEATAALAAALRIARCAEQAGLAVLNYEGEGAMVRRVFDSGFAGFAGPGGFDGVILPHWNRLAEAAHGLDTGGGRDDMPIEALVAAIADGRIAAERLDDAVARVLRLKYALGLLSTPLAREAVRPRGTMPSPAHNRAVALALARRCPVLLRNDPALLPLGVDSGDVLIVGVAATDRSLPLAGRPGTAASVIDGLEALGHPHRYVPGLALRHGDGQGDRVIAADRMALGMAAEAARRARTVVCVLGNGTDDGLPTPAQRQLLEVLRAANPRLVLVTLGPCPVDPVVGGAPLPAILHAGQLGIASGHAVAELLTGAAVPAGKLPVAIRSDAGEVSLPFGHGLSYADFALTGFALDRIGQRLFAHVDLRNGGEVAGTETLQLYFRRTHDAAGQRRITEPALRDFTRVTLAPGERRTLEFEIDGDIVGEHAPDGRFTVAPGGFEVRVGLSADRTFVAVFDLDAAEARAMLLRRGDDGDAARRRA